MNVERLCHWKSGDEGLVTELIGSSGLTDRLQELGVIPGAWVRIVQHGSPMLIQVGDSRICLRRADAASIGARLNSRPFEAAAKRAENFSAAAV
ncbi:MAG TPA: FeoA family protein [Planctomycetota bacterium]|jgi:Fe2+ transport system protein FeoA